MTDLAPSLLPYFVFFAFVSTTLLLLPFWPTWREWYQPSDKAALMVSQGQTNDPSYLAQQFRAQIQTQLANGTPVQNGSLKAAAALVQPLYATADLTLDRKLQLREVLCLGSLTIGTEGQISGWAHSDLAVVMAENCVMVRRVSSGLSISLADRCSFERLHAPVVHFGQPPVLRSAGRKQPVLQMLRHLAGAQRWGENAWRVDGDCEIPARHQFTGSLVVMGTLRVGEGTLIDGNVKAHKGICMGAGSHITGAVVCANGIHILTGSVVGGPLVSETHVLLHTRVCVGAPNAPTTVSASNILVDHGVTVHGTVWAREAGVVLELA
jgi:cytoskeletal protein CcmA (bactofilin family)